MAELLGDVYQGDSWNYPVRLVLGTAIKDTSCFVVLFVPRTRSPLSYAGDEGHSNIAHEL